MHRFLLCLLLALALTPTLSADDWPQWLGPKRDGVWRETGLVEKFPPGGPPVKWRTPGRPGYAGPAASGGGAAGAATASGARPAWWRNPRPVARRSSGARRSARATRARRSPAAA